MLSEATRHRPGQRARIQRKWPAQRTSASVGSNTNRWPRPWSSVPENFLSKIICDSFASTVSTGSVMSFATWASSTVENGSMTRHKFCSNSLSYNDARWRLINGSLPRSEQSSSGHDVRRTPRRNRQRGDDGRSVYLSRAAWN